MQNGLVSILIPFKNTEIYLSDCLDSIINQSYRHWGVLIVDDHSTDASYQLVAQYALKDKRIKLLKNNGNSIIDALRLAFANSEGEFLTRMDSDDIMHPDKLNILASNLKTFGKKHVAVGLVKYFSKGGIQEGYKS